MKFKIKAFSAISGIKNVSVWSNWLMALPLIGSAITLLPVLFVFTRLWAPIPKINFLQTDLANLKEISFFVAHLNAETFFFIAQMLLAVSSVVTFILMAYVFFQYLRKLTIISQSIWLVVLITALITIINVVNIKENTCDSGNKINCVSCNKNKCVSCLRLTVILAMKNQINFMSQCLRPFWNRLNVWKKHMDIVNINSLTAFVPIGQR